MPTLLSDIDAAARAGKLLPASASNLHRLLDHAASPLYAASVAELVAAGQWDELNDRFFATLAFGTGGLRGRTIGKIVTAAERGEPQALGRPEHPCVGTNAMNFYNISRSTQGLVRYLQKWAAQSGLRARPKIVVAYDTRHFSRDFAGLTAKIGTENGCDVALFDGPRSTPELSFAVRLTGAQAGIVITASHNPAHDDGYKVYFEDGAQIVEPHASGIIGEVNAVESEAYPARPPGERGALTVLDAGIDAAYLERLKTLVLDPGMLAGARDLRLVFTPIHGVGGVMTRPALEAFGLPYATVPEQDVMDGRFPTVVSPNPENAEALRMGMALADAQGADLVLATDPDCDRMGVAARDPAGQLTLLTGNQIGSLLAHYRLKTLFALGVLHEGNRGRAAIIKTFVTTDLQKAIAERFGVRCVETLTGFKYIGQKLGLYEDQLPAADRAGYRRKSEAETRALRLAHSTYFVFGGEESYGYSGADFTRDKDANGACLMFAEVAAHAKSRGLTLVELLDEVYAEFGFYWEKNANIVLEGADGAGKIQKLLASYESAPPAGIAAATVSATKNFAQTTFHDVEGQQIPVEKMLIFELANGGKVAVRGSGTEPKIKYYLFARRSPEAGQTFSGAELAAIKAEVTGELEETWAWLQRDAGERLKA